MIQFTRIEGPYGIPVYFQKLPAEVNPFSIRWIVFTGSADDRAVGGDGLYHWFEHVPMRGTVRFPNGYADTIDRFVPRGGSVNAHTGHVRTAFEAYVPKDCWREALALITDLMAQPVLTDAAICAEREVIENERQERLSELGNWSVYHLWALLWGDHPLGHDPLGGEATMRTMGPERLRHAHAEGYGRSRSVLVAAGDVALSDLSLALREECEHLPDHPIAERRVPACYGALPAWRDGYRDEVETSFSSSRIYLLFPVPPWRELPDAYGRCKFLSCLFGAGLNAPLNRILRAERNLTYGASIEFFLCPDGGFWGFGVDTKSPGTIEAVCQGLLDVLKADQLRSPEWYAKVCSAFRAVRDMRIVHPDEYADAAEERLVSSGVVLSDDEYVRAVTAYSHAEVCAELLKPLDPDRARTIIFRGTGKGE